MAVVLNQHSTENSLKASQSNWSMAAYPPSVRRIPVPVWLLLEDEELDDEVE
jgi:hypothetical protein